MTVKIFIIRCWKIQEMKYEIMNGKRVDEVEAIQIDKRMDLSSPDWWVELVQTNTVILHGMGKFTRDTPSVTMSYGVVGNQGDWIVYWDADVYIYTNTEFIRLFKKIE